MYFSAIYDGNKRRAVPDKPPVQTLGPPILWMSNNIINYINTIITIEPCADD